MSNKKRKKLILKQIKLQEKIQGKGLNIVVCGNCGTINIHKTNKDAIECYECITKIDVSDCSDLFYTGMPEAD